jgi:hypothetical protein
MINLGGYSYDDHKGCLTCQHVLDGSPILAVAHDKDGDLHFGCGAEGHSEDDWHVVGLSHLAGRLGDTDAFPLLPPERVASRSSDRDAWQVQPF